MKREACLVGALGLLGPCLGLVRLWTGGLASIPTLAAVWFDVTALMWPMWVLAVAEVTMGTTKAVLWSVSANVALFSVAGVIVAAIAPRRSQAMLAGAILTALMLAAVRLVAGIDPVEIGLFPIAVVWVVLSVALWVERRFPARQGQASSYGHQ